MFNPCDSFDMLLDDGEYIRLAVINDGVQSHVLAGVEAVSRTVTLPELLDTLCEYLHEFYPKEKAQTIKNALADRIRNYQ